jgi:hypothetical protein
LLHASDDSTTSRDMRKGTQEVGVIDIGRTRAAKSQFQGINLLRWRPLRLLPAQCAACLYC